jgi:hypothetical protein
VLGSGKIFGVFEIAGGPKFGGSNIITQAIKSLAGRLSAESKVITLASASRQR